MTDFNTWNESLIREIRKSSLFENDEMTQESDVCSRCEEIIAALELVLVHPNSKIDYQNKVNQAIEHIKAGRFSEVDINGAFWWDESPQTHPWWWNQHNFLRIKGGKNDIT